MTETKQLEKQETVSNENDAFASKALFSNIIPLGESCDEQSLPDFPVDVLNVLPPDIAKFITEISRIKHVPRSMMGVSVLSVLEIACRGRYPICLSDGYRERPCLYIVPIAGSGECKSSVESVVMKPLDDFEQDYNNEHRAEINKSIGIKKSLEEAFAKAQKEYTKSLLDTNPDKSCAAESLFLHMTRLLTDFEPVTELRLYGSDSTPEKLAQLLKEQGGTFAFVSDEGAEIIGNMGRYNDKGDGGLSVYLKGYSGGTISVDRIGRDRTFVKNAQLNILAFCQPCVIKDVFENASLAGRGLLARMLFVNCKRLIGIQYYVKEKIDEKLCDSYRNLCRAMLEANGEHDLQFDPQADDIYGNYRYNVGGKLLDNGELAFMSEWTSRASGTMARLAGLIHCISAFASGTTPEASLITAEEAQAAVILTDFFIAHAKYTHEYYTAKNEAEDIKNARYLWGRIKTLGSTVLTKSNIIGATRGKKYFDLNESLNVLIAHGYICVVSTPTENANKPTQMTYSAK